MNDWTEHIAAMKGAEARDCLTELVGHINAGYHQAEELERQLGKVVDLWGLAHSYDDEDDEED